MSKMAELATFGNDESVKKIVSFSLTTKARDNLDILAHFSGRNKSNVVERLLTTKTLDDIMKLIEEV